MSKKIFKKIFYFIVLVDNKDTKIKHSKRALKKGASLHFSTNIQKKYTYMHSTIQFVVMIYLKIMPNIH